MVALRHKIIVMTLMSCAGIEVANDTRLFAEGTARLDQRIDIRFVNRSLGDVLDYLRDQADIPVELDANSLRDERIDLSAAVTFEARMVVLRDALQVILLPLDLHFSERSTGILISYREPLSGARLQKHLNGSVVEVFFHTRSSIENARVAGMLMSETGGVESIVLEFSSGAFAVKKRLSAFGAESIRELHSGGIVLALDIETNTLIERHVAERNNRRHKATILNQRDQLEQKRRELGF